MTKARAVLLFWLAITIPTGWLLHGRARAESGIASVYAVSGKDRYAGRRSASGERVSPHALTAAHRTLPFGARVLVTNRQNGRATVVRITDRGPFIRGRVIDLTPAGARALGFSGLAPVTVARMSAGDVVRAVRCAPPRICQPAPGRTPGKSYGATQQ